MVFITAFTILLHLVQNLQLSRLFGGQLCAALWLFVRD